MDSLDEKVRSKLNQEGAYQGALLSPVERVELRQYLQNLEVENRIAREHLRRVDIDIADLRQRVETMEAQRGQNPK